ncbi:MAG: histidine kinase [Acidobacteriota bacterium]|nr:histidine kinase [Acidobacteriota bacterium]
MNFLYQNRRILIISFIGWTLFGLFFSCQVYLNYAYLGRPEPLGRILVAWLTCSYLWALLTPLVLYLARRFPIEREAIFRRVATHLFFGSLFALLQLGVYIFAHQWLLGDSLKPFSPLQSFQNILVAEFHFNLLLYLTIVGLYQAFDYYRRFREREQRAGQLELEAAQLETALAQAQLDTLKMQLHPHFLFNTLNTISVLMREEDVETANLMLIRLSELLRIALKTENTQVVSLRQELDFLRGYLEIEQTRFQDRLKVVFEIEAETLDAQVPNLILQPLVENAVRHGIAPRAEAGTIQIGAKRNNGFIELSVSDNGAGLTQAEADSNGIGLANTRARLEKLYGASHKFDLSSPENGGLQVTIKIPFRTNEYNR